MKLSMVNNFPFPSIIVNFIFFIVENMMYAYSNCVDKVIWELLHVDLQCCFLC
jgi:hypothetical protein